MGERDEGMEVAKRPEGRYEDFARGQFRLFLPLAKKRDRAHLTPRGRHGQRKPERHLSVTLREQQ
jgi:hypothetical protein